MSKEIKKDDPDKIVEQAISRMMSDAVVKEERRSIRFWVALIGLFLSLGIFVASYDFKYQVPAIVESEQDSNSVSLVQDKNGHYFAKGKINGQAVNFIVDTGATTVAIPEAVAEKLGLVKGELVLSSTANGMSTGSSTILRKVELGAVVRYSVKAVILPNMQSDQILLGMSFLKNLRVVQDDSELIITQ